MSVVFVERVSLQPLTMVGFSAQLVVSLVQASFVVPR